MDGMTILQIFEHIPTTWGWSWWLCLPISFMILIIVMGIYLRNIDTLPIFFVLFALCLTATLGIASSAQELPPTYTYQVLINESINITEFAEKYEILEQQGLTYIVREKD